MSYIITKHVSGLPGLTITEKAVAHVLADHAHPDGTNASMATIATEMGFKNRRNAQRVVRQLEKKGVIVAETNKAGGRSRTTSYRFNLNSVSTDTLSQTASDQVTKDVSTGQKGCPDGHPKEGERNIKEYTGARAPFIERDHCYHLPGCDCVSPREEFEWIVNQQLDEEDEIIANLPKGLTAWVASLKPLALPGHLSESDAAAAFAGVNDLLYISGPAIEGEHLPGCARLFGSARGSSWTLLDYERIWALEERYGVGTCVALAEKILELVKRDAWHPISIDSFIWNHIADQLCDA